MTANTSKNSRFSRRGAVSLGVVAAIACAHIFRIGSYLGGNIYNLYYSYFSDIAIPFGCYFLLCATELKLPMLKSWRTKLAIVIILPSIAETGQLLGIPVLGSTFDPLDYLMYICGALFAVIVDQQVFSRIFDFWTIEQPRR
jgi:hypothetical protein